MLLLLRAGVLWNGEWSDDRHFDGDHRTIDVYEDLDLVVYLEEIEPEGE